jgi:GH43 family beta-xylosidase
MIPEPAGSSRLRYKNPVFPHSFPDPFVIKHNGEYFAYCTGHWHDGRVFGVLRSADLIDWEPVGGAMKPLDDPAPFYWAPEVTYSNGTFYLYYSVGNEALMHLRVATSDRPDGGFTDTGHRLTFQDFAIDAHVFQDDDGRRYMFYATDFLEHSHIGTGIVMDRMIDWQTLAGDPRPVVRAKYDWQVYDPARKEKGGVRWHTVEGPYVFKRKGVYFVMFSGGNWQNISYGVSFAASAEIVKDGEWAQFCDGENVLPILRTYPDLLIGPGHNSVIRGPDNRELYCIYHCWENGERVVAANRMDIIGGRLVIEPEPYTPKSVPSQPERKKVDVAGSVTGLPASFLCEFAFDSPAGSDDGRFGFRLADDAGDLGELILRADGGEVRCVWNNADGDETGQSESLALGAVKGSIPVRLEVDHHLLNIQVNGRRIPVNTWLERTPESLNFCSENGPVTWPTVELTEGFEDLFEPDDGTSLSKTGWHLTGPEGSAVFGDGHLLLSSTHGGEVSLRKAGPDSSFDHSWVVRAEAAGEDGRSGFFIEDADGKRLFSLDLAGAGDAFRLVDDSKSLSFELPFDNGAADLHRFGFTKFGAEIAVSVDLVPIASLPLTSDKVRVGIRCINSQIAIESVRYTAHPWLRHRR